MTHSFVQFHSKYLCFLYISELASFMENNQIRTGLGVVLPAVRQHLGCLFQHNGRSKVSALRIGI